MSDRGYLTARVGQMCRRIAAVVDKNCTPESGAAEAVGFLRDWADAADDRGARTPSAAETPLTRIVHGFALTDLEIDLLILAGVPEEHEGLAATLRTLHPTGEPRPTAGLAALVFGGDTDTRAHLRETLTSGAAVRHGLLSLGGSGPYFERSLVLADELWPALHGHDAWPASLRRVATTGGPAGMASWLMLPDAAAGVSAVRNDEPALVAVLDENPIVARGRCETIATAAGRDLVGATLSASSAVAVSLLVAHAVARGSVPLVDIDRTEQPVDVPLGDFAGAVLVSAAPGALAPPRDRALVRVASGPAPLTAIRDAWAAAVPGLADDADTLAGRHPLDPALTAQVARDLGLSSEPPSTQSISRAVRSRAAVNLPPGTRLVVPDIAWEQLVLPSEAMALLHAAVDRLSTQATVLDDWRLAQVAQATRGVRLLFTGLPGTGKSLAAAALATAIGTDLMIVDVARLVSKWLGETEKNLSATFEAAERTRAVLLLDEADALFGTRTEISDSHDRYANLETAYLLQRVEQFEGLVVLTSNLRQNIDAAFTRRLDFVVEFPLPDLPARRALWDHLLPEALGSVRGADVDPDALAGIYPIPGGWIRNAAVAAAFAAASDGGIVTQRSLIDAVRREYQKASTPFPGEPPRRRDDHDR